MRMPEPTAREVRWSFYVVAACGLALTATIVWGIVHKVNQSDEIVRVAVSSANQVERLSSQLDAQSAQLDALKLQAAADAEASAEAARAAAWERKQNRAILDYLREQGINIPQSLAPRSGGDDPKDRGPRGPQPAPPTQSPQASPGPPPATPSPSPGVLDFLCDLVPLVCPLI